jgi:hypothetical protein
LWSATEHVFDHSAGFNNTATLVEPRITKTLRFKDDWWRDDLVNHRRGAKPDFTPMHCSADGPFIIGQNRRIVVEISKMA